MTEYPFDKSMPASDACFNIGDAVGGCIIVDDGGNETGGGVYVTTRSGCCSCC